MRDDLKKEKLRICATIQTKTKGFKEVWMSWKRVKALRYVKTSDIGLSSFKDYQGRLVVIESADPDF